MSKHGLSSALQRGLEQKINSRGKQLPALTSNTQNSNTDQQHFKRMKWGQTAKFCAVPSP